MSRINWGTTQLYGNIGRLAMTALIASSAVMIADSPVRAGPGDFLGGVGVGIILNEAIRGGSHSGSSRHSAYTEQHKTQQALADLGFYDGPVDGTNGPETRAAVSDYQASKGLPETGVLNIEQRALMIAEAEIQETRIYLGARDGVPLPERDQKKRVQAALKLLGHYDGDIDGIFGRGTARSIKSYQQSEGLPVTGVLTGQQEKGIVEAAHNMLDERVAGIERQFASMTGRPQTTPIEPDDRDSGSGSSKSAASRPSTFPPIEELKTNLTPKREYDVAVIIGNKSYIQDDIPDVAYGDRDAEAIHAVLVNDLGFDPANIIVAKDASQGEMLAIFGSETNIQGRLWRYIDPNGKSSVFVYYSGHGAPDVRSHVPYLLPVDTDPNAIALNGYSLNLMYKNLSKLSVKSVSVMLDACFSGGSHQGMLIKSASPVMVSAEMPQGPTSGKLTVLAAADGNQLASWDEKKGHGIFTSHLLDGMKGKADKNQDGKITAQELYSYVSYAVQRQARREFGRVQTPTLLGDPNRVVGLLQ